MDNTSKIDMSYIYDTLCAEYDRLRDFVDARSITPSEAAAFYFEIFHRYLMRKELTKLVGS